MNQGTTRFPGTKRFAAAGAPWRRPAGGSLEKKENPMKDDNDTARACAWCGEPVDRYALLIAMHGGNPRHHSRRYCSPACRNAAKAARKEGRG